MRILLIGGTGFIGAHVLRLLVEGAHSVAVFNRGQTQIEIGSIGSSVKQFCGDRTKLLSFVPDFNQFAADVVLDMIPYTERDALALTNTFRGITSRVVAISSMDVYAAYGRFIRSEIGEPDKAPLQEDGPLRKNLYPYRAYAQSSVDLMYDYEKILVERIVMNDSKLSGTILRLAKVYGHGDKKHLTFDYVKRMDDKRPAILLEERKAQWRWTRGYVENVAAAIVLAVTKDQAAERIYNVGESDALTEAKWVENLGHAAGWNGEIAAVPRNILPKHLAEEYDYRHHLNADTSLIRNELGYDEPVKRPEALKQTVAWERNNSPNNIDPRKFDYSAEDAALMKLRR